MHIQLVHLIVIRKSQKETLPPWIMDVIEINWNE